MKRLVIAIVLVLSLVDMASAAEFVATFLAYQGRANLPVRSHCFATFAKIDNGRIADTHTISWMPTDTKYVSAVPKRPTAGVNWSLQRTLAWATKIDAQIVAWGPYRIDQDLYDRAVARTQALDQGVFAYKALDYRSSKTGTAINCQTACGDLDELMPLRTGTKYGHAAGEVIVRHLARWLCEQRPELIGQMGLQGYRISWRPCTIGRMDSVTHLAGPVVSVPGRRSIAGHRRHWCRCPEIAISASRDQPSSVRSTMTTPCQRISASPWSRNKGGTFSWSSKTTASNLPEQLSA